MEKYMIPSDYPAGEFLQDCTHDNYLWDMGNYLICGNCNEKLEKSNTEEVRYENMA